MVYQTELHENDRRQTKEVSRRVKRRVMHHPVYHHQEVYQPLVSPSTPAINTILLPLLPEAEAPRFPRAPTCALPPPLRFVPSLKHSALSKDALIMVISDTSRIELGLSLEKVKNVLHAELADSFTALDSSLRKLAFSFLEFEDALFDRVVDGEAVDGDIDGLIKAVDAVDCLLLDKLLYAMLVHISHCVGWERG